MRRWEVSCYPNENITAIWHIYSPLIQHARRKHTCGDQQGRDVVIQAGRGTRIGTRRIESANVLNSQQYVLYILIDLSRLVIVRRCSPDRAENEAEHA